MEKHQWKLLHFAAYTDWPEETIKVLLKTITIPNPSQIDIDELAEVMVWPKDVLLEVVKSANNINAGDKHKRTALHIAANRDNYRFVRCLLKLGKTNVDAVDERNWTCMHYAAKQGHGRVITSLCLQNADSNIKTKDGSRTPIHFAALEGHTHIVRMLYHHGRADITPRTSKGRTVVHLAASNPDNAECLQTCLEFGYFNVNDPDNTANTALHYAAECGSYEMVKILAVDHKAKVNVQDKTKQTPCHIAAYNGDLDIVEILVEQGTDLKLKDEDGVTILEYAMEEGHKDIVRYLKKKLGMKISDDDLSSDEEDDQSDIGSECSDDLASD